jgi:hypothetical protein
MTRRRGRIPTLGKHDHLPSVETYPCSWCGRTVTAQAGLDVVRCDDCIALHDYPAKRRRSRALDVMLVVVAAFAVASVLWRMFR